MEYTLNYCRAGGVGNNNLSCHSLIFLQVCPVKGYGTVGGFWPVWGGFEASSRAALRVPSLVYFGVPFRNWSLGF